jgi:hypothetical protein
MKKAACLLFLSAFLAGSAIGQEIPEKKQYHAERITKAPVIDGKLDDEVWSAVEWTDDFTQFEPYNGQSPSQRTEFKILFDENNIYAAFKAYDTNPDSIINRLTRRDSPDGDLVAVCFDSYHDLRTGFIFGVSSAGVKYDFITNNDGQNEDSSWDPNWWAGTAINDEGWIAEMRIPFSQVRFEKNSGDIWGLQVVRVLYRKNETSFWAHIPKDSPGLVHLFGEISGMEDIKPRKIFDVTPYAVAKAETFKREPEDPFRSTGKSSGLKGGVDAKIGVTNNITMDLTINPDFGQVEADPSEVNLTAFETFFSEKRPFFIEGRNITSFNLGLGDGDVGNDNLFYSRRLGRRPQLDPELEDNWNMLKPSSTNILGAAKLTGKTKDALSVGIVNVVTAEESAEIDTSGGRISEIVEPLTNYFVGRVQKDYKQGTRILGGIFTGTNRNLHAASRDFLHSSAYTGGLDFTQYLRDKSWMFNLNAAFSTVQGSAEAIKRTQKSSARYFQRPDNYHTRFDTTRTSLSGSGGRMQLMKMNGHWNYLVATMWKTPGFEINDLGYMREADQLFTAIWAGYNQWAPKWIYRSYRFNFDVFTESSFGGEILNRGFEWNGSMNLKNYWSLWTGGNISGNSLSVNLLRGGPSIYLPGTTNYRLGFSSDNRKKFRFDFSVNASEGHLKYRSNLNLFMTTTWKPIDFLSASLTGGYGKSFDELQYVDNVQYYNTDKYIFASIKRNTFNASFRINLNVTPDLTFQYWGQPFVSAGKYFDHKIITDPASSTFSGRFRQFCTSQLTLTDDGYDVDENLDGVSDYSFSSDDFKVQEFLSNLVIRWEYSPGSTLYIVWNQSRSFEGSGNMDYFNDLGDLFNRRKNTPHNVFLIKFSYRFGLK